MSQCAWPKCRESDPDELAEVVSGGNDKSYLYCDEHLPEIDGERWVEA